MTRRIDRRALLLAAASGPLWPCAARASAAEDALAALEAQSGGRLGLAACDTGRGTELFYRAEERFAFCSTFKVLAAAALLKRGRTERDLLARRIPYGEDVLVRYSPITEKHVGAGLTVAELCAAAIQYSDNTAGNLMIELLGGPPGVTRLARSIGDDSFRLDRWETALNTAIPDDPRDTTTPHAMMRSLYRLAVGAALAAQERAQLVAWMKGCKTGDNRIRAGLPAGWVPADKTGTGDYGTTNAIGIAWPPKKHPLVLVIYFTQPDPAAKPREDIVAAATRIAVEHLA